MTSRGALRGVQVGEVLHFRGIPYAEAERFAAPRPAPRWQSELDAARHGPICPQARSPLSAVMGDPDELPQAEACLTLSVAAPTAAGPLRPVMVWLHGGAYVVGAASYAWYRPDALVREGDVIVVNVNYRLGVFGWLHMPEVSPGNLGLLDQLEALRWVQENIEAFGGDPGRVTLFGESAGAHSIAALLAAPDARGLFQRAIAQSGQLGLGFLKPAQALRTARTLQRHLGSDDLRDATPERLLAAQQATLIELSGPGGFNSAPPFGPVGGVAPLPQPARFDATSAVVHGDVDLLIGSTREEMRAFFDTNPNIARLRSLPLAGHRAFAGLTSAVTQRVFTRPAQRLADAQARTGGAVYLYAFDWAPSGAGFGACHTLDLPFVFGSDAWRGAPMLGQTAWETIVQRGHELRRAWTRFASTGDPNTATDPSWPRHEPGAAPGRRFHWQD